MESQKISQTHPNREKTLDRLPTAVGLERADCLGLNRASQEFRESANPSRVGRPSGSGYQVSVNMSAVESLVGCRIRSPPGGNFVLNGWVTAALLASEYPGSSQDLRPMADRCDRFVGGRKVFDHLQNPSIESQVLRCAAAGQYKCIVLGRINRSKIRIEDKAVPRLLAVSLMPFEIMDSGRYVIAGYLAWTNAMAIMPDHREHLVRDHDLVVFYKVTNEKQNLFYCPFL